MVIVSLLNNWDQYGESGCEDTKTWKVYVLEWLYEYRNVFLKTKSERIPL